jgi:hypothetical protein
MSEDTLKQLKKQREERQESYTQFKSMMQGIRLTKLSPVDESLLTIVEKMVEGFKNFGDGLDYISEGVIRLTQRVEALEKDVKQLRDTLDTLNENR